MNLALTPLDLGRLLDYLALLRRWNKVYNLTALRSSSMMVSHHLADCLAVVRPLETMLTLRRQTPNSAPPKTAVGNSEVRVVDVGSGGGLPGIVLAIAHQDWTVHCVDAVAKKTSFVRQVAVELGLKNLVPIHGRVTTPPVTHANNPSAGPANRHQPMDKPGSTPRPPLESASYDLVISRAFASLAGFTNLTRHLLAPHGCWVAMKAHLHDEELSELAPDVEVFHVEQLAVPGLDAQRCLVWMAPRPN